MSDSPAEGRLETRRIAVFLGVTFIVSWSIAGVMFLVPWAGPRAEASTLAFGLLSVVVSTGFMFGPTVGHVVTRTVTGEGWTRASGDGGGDGLLDRLHPYLPRADTYLWPRIRQGWPYLIAGVVLPAVFAAVGAATYFVVFPDQFAGLAPIREMLSAIEAQTGQSIGLSPTAYLFLVVIVALLFGVPFNSVSTFGEEFGWRGYLLPKLLPLGRRRAVLLLGVIWGVWHWPLTAMGHNYLLDYPFAPVPGMLVMLWFTTAVGTVFAWLTLRSGSVWPAVLGHASLNAVAGLGLLVASGEPNLLLGPTSAGLIGALPYAVLAAWILVDPDRLRPPEFDADVPDDPDGAAPAAVAGPPTGGSSAAAVSEEDRDA